MDKYLYLTQKDCSYQQIVFVISSLSTKSRARLGGRDTQFFFLRHLSDPLRKAPVSEPMTNRNMTGTTARIWRDPDGCFPCLYQSSITVVVAIDIGIC
jgi:hypothetical protein